MKLSGATLSIQLNGTRVFVGLRGSHEHIEERFTSLTNAGYLRHDTLRWVTNESAYFWCSKEDLIKYFIHVQEAQLWTRSRIIVEGKTWRKKARQEAEEFFNSLPRTGYFVSKKPQTHIYARGAAEGLSSFPKQYANANETI